MKKRNKSKTLTTRQSDHRKVQHCRTDHREVAELAALTTSPKVADELGLSSYDSSVVLATRPTDVVRQDTGVLHSKVRQFRSASQLCVTA